MGSIAISIIRADRESGEISRGKTSIPPPYITLMRNVTSIPSQKKGKRIIPINNIGI